MWEWAVRAGRARSEPHSQLHVLQRRGAAGPAAVAVLPLWALENTADQGSVSQSWSSHIGRHKCQGFYL